MIHTKMYKIYDLNKNQIEFEGPELVYFRYN